MIKYIIEKKGKYFFDNGTADPWVDHLEDAELFDLGSIALDPEERLIKVAVSITFLEYVR